MFKTSQDSVSMDSKIGDDETTLGDFLSDDSSLAIDSEINHRLLREELEKAMHDLDDREKTILRKRYGFEDGQVHTLEEVGSEFGITRERVRQIENRALRKLKNPSKSKNLKEFLSDT